MANARNRSRKTPANASKELAAAAQTEIEECNDPVSPAPNPRSESPPEAPETPAEPDERDDNGFIEFSPVPASELVASGAAATTPNARAVIDDAATLPAGETTPATLPLGTRAPAAATSLPGSPIAVGSLPRLKQKITRSGRFAQDPARLAIFERLRKPVGGASGKHIGDPAYPLVNVMISVETSDKTDIRPAWYYSLMEYCALVSEIDCAGALEKGEENGGLHAHGVCHGVHAPEGKDGVKAIREDFRAFTIGKQTKIPLKVHVRILDKGGEETVERKMGYIQKDREQPHFAFFHSEQLTADYFQACIEDYEIVACDKLRGKVVLRHSDFISHTTVFEQKYLSALALPPHFIWYYMVRHEGFTFAKDFVVGAGGRWVDYKQFQSFWRVRHKPEVASLMDIGRIVYGPRDDRDVVTLPPIFLKQVRAFFAFSALFFPRVKTLLTISRDRAELPVARLGEGQGAEQHHSRGAGPECGCARRVDLHAAQPAVSHPPGRGPLPLGRRRHRAHGIRKRSPARVDRRRNRSNRQQATFRA